LKDAGRNAKFISSRQKFTIFGGIEAAPQEEIFVPLFKLGWDA